MLEKKQPKIWDSLWIEEGTKEEVESRRFADIQLLEERERRKYAEKSEKIYRKHSVVIIRTVQFGRAGADED